MMKRSYIVLLALAALLVGLTACGRIDSGQKSAQSEESETAKTITSPTSVKQLVENGYNTGVSCFDDGVYTIEFISGDRSDYQLVSCEMTEDEFNKMDSIDIGASDYDSQLAEYLDGLGDQVTFTCLDDKIPDTKEMQAYVGKTFADLEDAGFWQSSAGNDPDDTGLLYLEYSDDEYVYAVYPEGDYKALMDLPEDYVELKIKEIRFSDFGDASVYAPQK